jgi:hypothetical protein
LFSIVEKGTLPVALREDAAVAARAEIIECLQHDEASTSATFFCE